MITGFTTQDTIKPRFVVRISTEKLLNDSVFKKLDKRSDSLILAASGRFKKPIITTSAEEEIIIDTTAVCSRNSIADVTFYDSNNLVSRINLPGTYRFHFLFTEKNEQKNLKEKTVLINNLKEGLEFSGKPIHKDWIIVIILFAAFLFLLIRSTAKSILPEVRRFILLRGINDPDSRDISGMFHWQSTLLNLISFIILGLFAYCAASWYDFIPKGVTGVSFWLIAFGIIATGVTLRHFVCTAVGNISEESDAFNEYLIGIYKSYRYSSIVIFVLNVLLVYTVIFPPQVYFIAGLILLIITYLLRISRLFLIFLKRDISIFYLILYLCGLEILPVLISLKYFTGLV